MSLENPTWLYRFRVGERCRIPFDFSAQSTELSNLCDKRIVVRMSDCNMQTLLYEWDDLADPSVIKKCGDCPNRFELWTPAAMTAEEGEFYLEVEIYLADRSFVKKFKFLFEVNCTLEGLPEGPNFDIASGDVTVLNLAPVCVEDLASRDALENVLTGQVVYVEDTDGNGTRDIFLACKDCPAPNEWISLIEDSIQEGLRRAGVEIVPDIAARDALVDVRQGKPVYVENSGGGFFALYIASVDNPTTTQWFNVTDDAINYAIQEATNTLTPIIVAEATQAATDVFNNSFPTEFDDSFGPAFNAAFTSSFTTAIAPYGTTAFNDGRYAPLVHNHDDLYYGKAELYTQAQANALFATQASVYTQTQADTLFATIASTYTQAQANSLFATQASVYTQSQIDSTFATIASTYTQTQANSLFAPIVHNHDSLYYTKAQSDALYATIASTYTQAQADSLFAPTVHNHDSLYYTKTQSDSLYAPSAHNHNTLYYQKTEVYNKTEADSLFGPGNAVYFEGVAVKSLNLAFDLGGVAWDSSAVTPIQSENFPSITIGTTAPFDLVPAGKRPIVRIVGEAVVAGGAAEYLTIEWKFSGAGYEQKLHNTTKGYSAAGTVPVYYRNIDTTTILEVSPGGALPDPIALDVAFILPAPLTLSVWNYTATLYVVGYID